MGTTNPIMICTNKNVGMLYLFIIWFLFDIILYYRLL